MGGILWFCLVSDWWCEPGWKTAKFFPGWDWGCDKCTGLTWGFWCWTLSVTSSSLKLSPNSSNISALELSMFDSTFREWVLDRQCLYRLLWVLKAILHGVHGKGRSFVWVLICLSNTLGFVHEILQYGQTFFLGFSRENKSELVKSSVTTEGILDELCCWICWIVAFDVPKLIRLEFDGEGGGMWT